MTGLPPCDRCGRTTTQQVAAEYLCADHADDVLEPLREKWLQAEGFVGWGIAYADRGAGLRDLRCRTCGATWVGRNLDPCAWCERQGELAVKYQAELALTPPDVDHDDERYADVMTAWGKRMAHAIAAEIITRAQANAAWNKATRGNTRDVAA